METLSTYRFTLTYKFSGTSRPEMLDSRLEAVGAHLIRGGEGPESECVLAFRRAADEPSLALLSAMREVRKLFPQSQLIAASPLTATSC